MTRLMLSPADTLFTQDDYPVEFVFFYRSPIAVDRLRSALKEASLAFWPAFGEYRDGAICPKAYCEERTFALADVPEPLELASAAAPAWDVVAPLRAPERPGELFSIKLTRFEGGAAIGARLSHLAGDGYSYFHLMAALANLAFASGNADAGARARELPPPTHARTVLREAPRATDSGWPAPVKRSFEVQLDSVPYARVYSVAKEAARSGGERISLNDVLCALTIQRLLELDPEALPDPFTVTIPIDVRPQIPEYGLGYFGNGVWYHRLQLDRGTVRRMPTQELAARIRRSMPAISAEGYARHLDGLGELASLGPGEPRLFDPRAGCLVTNVSQLPFSLLDFGAGAPSHVVPIMKEKYSATVLANGRDYTVRVAY